MKGISVVVGDGKIKRYDDLLADVRHDHEHHSIRSLVQVNDQEVRDIARVLVQSPDFINTAQEFVNSFTTYGSEVGDFWRTPSETLEKRTAVVVTKGEGGEDRIIESTAPPGKSTRGKYVIYGMFNDCYAFSTDIGLKEFDLKTVELAEPSLRR